MASKDTKENIPEEEPEDFEAIVAENIKAQEANLNVMKKIAGSLFGHTL